MLKKWFRILSFGETKRYARFILWFLFDSVIASLPYGLVLIAIYFILGPLQSAGSALNSKALWYVVMVLGFQALIYLFVRMKSYVLSSCGMARSMKKSRMDIGEHLRKLSLGFFNQRDTGELSTVILRDLTTIENLSNSFVPQIGLTFVRLILSFVMLSIFDIRMSLALFITIPCAIPFVIISYKRMSVTGVELMDVQQQSVNGILEYVQGIQTLRAFNQSGEKFSKLKDSFAKQKETSIQIETKAASPVASLGRMVLNLGIVFTMITGGLLTVKLQLNVFYFIAFMVMALNIYEPVSIMMFFIADFARSNRAYERIEEIYAQKPLEQKTENQNQIKNNTITFENVTFGYNEKAVLKNVSAEFPENSITALVGPSGSGKSTITKLIGRFWDVKNGDIKLGGVSIKDLSQDQLLSRISMVFQDVYLFHDTIENNIRMGKENATREEIIAAAKKACCHQFIMSLPDGYDTMVGEGGSTLSGGEKQRISIARALIKNAPIVLLDEATASLDPENEVLIQNAISELVREKTVIIVAHRLQSVSNADQILVLSDGGIKEKGNHKTLLEKDGMYANLWKEQQTAGKWSIN